MNYAQGAELSQLYGMYFIIAKPVSTHYIVTHTDTYCSNKDQCDSALVTN